MFPLPDSTLKCQLCTQRCVGTCGSLVFSKQPVTFSSELPNPGDPCMIVDLISLLLGSVSMNLTLKYELEGKGDAQFSSVLPAAWRVCIIGIQILFAR